MVEELLQNTETAGKETSVDAYTVKVVAGRKKRVEHDKPSFLSIRYSQAPSGYN